MIAVVVPTIRPERMEWFRGKWADLFRKHKVMLITVWDGEVHRITTVNYGSESEAECTIAPRPMATPGLIYRFTDSCRNLGFVVAAELRAEYILTLDDDVAPWNDLPEQWPIPTKPDPIQQHLDVLRKRVPLHWMNTATGDAPYLRGVPYNIRDEAPVKLSHGVWTGTPDWDGETQLKLQMESRRPFMNYYAGPVPRGVAFPLCGMNVMIHRDALRYFYFAPMGPDTGLDNLHRFGDIWMGIYLKAWFDRIGWACYTGGSVVHHTRASDANKNIELERLGREWNEVMWQIEFGRNYPAVTPDSPLGRYLLDYYTKRQQWAALIDSIQGGGYEAKGGA